jgi:transposase
VICSLGTLQPAPTAEWLARKLHAALAGQEALLPDARVEALLARARWPRRATPPRAPAGELVTIDAEGVRTEEARAAGPVHVGHQFWRLLGLNGILAAAGLRPRACLLTEVMTLNRLVHPASEHAMPGWIRRTALGDILGADFRALSDEALYRNLDRLHPQRGRIEQALAERERTLFNLDDTIDLYELTSTYFEGQCRLTSQARRGYSRDQRPDCKQILVGLVLDREGFPKAHEVFDGNRQDRVTLDEMLAVLEARTGQRGGATVVVDRGMAFDENLAQIRARGHHYVVAGRPSERAPHLAAFAEEAGWQAVLRTPSPRNPAQRKSRVFVKRQPVGQEVYVLCRSEGREDKDRAIRDKHEQRLLHDLERLQARVARGRLRAEAKVREAIGRLKERDPRVARYDAIAYDPATRAVTGTAHADRQAKAETLEGASVLRTDRVDLSGEDLWRLSILLTRVEAAFRAMKSPLMERPIFHHLQHRVQTHICLCGLAYHLLVAIEKRFLDQGRHTSWATLREELTPHQVVTVVLPRPNGKTLRLRKGTTPEPPHRDISRTLQIPAEVMKPRKSWTGPTDRDATHA